MTSYRRSLRFSMFSAGIFFAGVGMGGFLWPPSLGVSLLTIRSVWSTVAAVYDRRYSSVSDIEDVLRNCDDVLEVEMPRQYNFDRLCCHCQQKVRLPVEPNRLESMVKI